VIGDLPGDLDSLTKAINEVRLMSFNVIEELGYRHFAGNEKK